jgi:hypothetical protein
MTTVARCSATLAAALLAACSDSPTMPAAGVPRPADAPSAALAGGGDFDPVEGPLSVTVRVENYYYNSSVTLPHMINGFLPAEFVKRELTNVKVRFSVQNATGATIDSKDVLDNSAADADKRVGYFKVSTAAGRTVKATLLAVDAPFTVAAAGNRTQVVDQQAMNLGKLVVNRLPHLEIAVTYYRFPDDSSSNHSTGNPDQVGSYTTTGPDGFHRSVAKAYTGSWEADVTPGAYTTCRTAPAGYSWYTWYGQKTACDVAQLAYNRATDVSVSFYPLD